MTDNPTDIPHSTGAPAHAIRFVVGEDRFDLLLEAAPDAMVIVNLTGNIVALNQQAERLFLYRRDELLGQPLECLLPERERPHHAEHRRDFFAEPRFRPMGMGLALAARRKDGSEFPVEISLSPLHTADGVLVISAIRDITDRRPGIDAQHGMNERARHLASLAELNPDLVLEMDLAGQITFANPASQRILERLGQNPTNVGALVPADIRGILEDWDKKSALSLDREIGIGERVYGVTVALIPELGVARIYGHDITERKQAREHIVHLNDELTLHRRDLEKANEELEVANEELRGANEELAKEVVERRRAEEALRDSEGQYRSLFENMLDGFAYCQMLLDPQGLPVDFVYLYVNAAFETLTGLTNVAGKRVSEVIPGIRDQHPELFEIYGRVAQTGQPERLVIDFKPLAIWLSVSVYSPKKGHFVAVFDNITERKRAEAEHEQMHRDLERHARELEMANNELEAITYAVAHDLRGPLNQVDQLTSLALDEYGAQLPEAGQQILHLVQQNAKTMNRLAEDLLTLARLAEQSPAKQTVSMSNLVREALEELRPAHGDRQVDIRVGDLPSALADPLWIKQAWVHLLSNALKFTRTREEAEIEIGSARQQGLTLYWVKDNGAGFDMAHADRLFRAFQRLHHADDFEGNGLGLAVVERIIRRHGGRVWAESEVGKGAAFYFSLG